MIAEGAGGVLVPLNEQVLTADLAARLALPAVVVVPNELGCINQALLTVEALRRRGIGLIGLVFNRRRPGGDDVILRDNPRIIARLGQVEVLGELPYLGDRPAELQPAATAFEPIGQAFLLQWKRIHERR